MKLSNKIVDDPQIEMMDTKTTIALNNFMKKNNKLSHIDLSNTFLAERAVHYIIKRMAKSVNIQSVHLSGVRD